MGYAADQPVPWPATPNWAQPVTETLTWLTDVMQANATGTAQVRALRTAPWRGFAWQSLSGGDDRRIVDTVRREIGAAPCVLPIWPDVQWLAAALPAGSTGISCATEGYDFALGGQAILWRTANVWELVTLSGMTSGALTFSVATTQDWGVGDRLYPVRQARLAQPAQETQHSDDTATLDVQALIDEPCDWTAAWPSATTYRSLAVLDWRGDERTDPTDQWDRRVSSIDTGTGPVYYDDASGVPYRQQSLALTLAGRADHSRFRALVYQLAGRAGPCWLPDWQASLRLAAAAASGATTISVGWAGLAAFGGPRPNRRDLRIELLDGTVQYRRITACTDAGATETLTLDAALTHALTPATVRQINLLAVCALASDTVQMQHITDADGIGTATLQFEALADDV